MKNAQENRTSVPLPLKAFGQDRAPDKDRFFPSIMPFSSPIPLYDHLLESSHRDDSNKWSNIGFGEEITKTESIEVNFTGIIWCPDKISFKPDSIHVS